MHVGEHVIGRPEQSQVSVHVGEHRATAIGRPEQSHVAVHVGEHVIGRPEQSQVSVHVGEHRAAAIGRPEQSHVAVHVGEHVIGRPEQSQVAVHVGEHVIGRPEQSHVAVHVGEHVIGRPEQSHVAVHVGEQRATAATRGRPEQSQVSVHVGEHVIGRPEQSHVAVHVGEQRAAAVGAGGVTLTRSRAGLGLFRCSGFLMLALAGFCTKSAFCSSLVTQKRTALPASDALPVQRPSTPHAASSLHTRAQKSGSPASSCSPAAQLSATGLGAAGVSETRARSGTQPINISPGFCGFSKTTRNELPRCATLVTSAPFESTTSALGLPGSSTTFVTAAFSGTGS